MALAIVAEDLGPGGRVGTGQGAGHLHGAARRAIAVQSDAGTSTARPPGSVRRPACVDRRKPSERLACRGSCGPGKHGDCALCHRSYVATMGTTPSKAVEAIRLQNGARTAGNNRHKHQGHRCKMRLPRMPNGCGGLSPDSWAYRLSTIGSGSILPYATPETVSEIVGVLSL